MGSFREHSSFDGHITKMATLRRYATFVVMANLVWESIHLPLFTIWTSGGAVEMISDVLFCTTGDVMIAGAAILGSLLLLRPERWPDEHYLAVAILTVLLGLSITIFSEWLNIHILERWNYSELMPTLPVVGTGLSPIAQWVVIPVTAFWWARRSMDKRQFAEWESKRSFSESGQFHDRGFS